MEVSANQSFKIIFYAEEVTDTTWTVGPLSNGTTYYWHVSAFNDLGWSNPSSDWHFTTQSAPSISLSWTSSTSATPPAYGSSCNPKFSDCHPQLT